jgi:hypothetical protein
MFEGEQASSEIIDIHFVMPVMVGQNYQAKLKCIPFAMLEGKWHIAIGTILSLAN